MEFKSRCCHAEILKVGCCQRTCAQCGKRLDRQTIVRVEAPSPPTPQKP